MTRPDDFFSGLLMLGLLAFGSGATLGAVIVYLVLDWRGRIVSHEPVQDASATVLTPGHGLPDVEPLDEYNQARHEAHLRGQVEQVLRGIPDWHS